MTRVLIVDDNSENRYMLRALLQGHGWFVQEAHNGAEALTMARQTAPDLIVSDLLMPVMDGYTLLRQWKADEQLESIPFVVYTATYTDPREERLALDLGADAFLVKPAEPEQFMACIQEVLKRLDRARSPVREPRIEESVLLKEYNEALVRKLEKRAQQLEQANRELLEEIDQNKRLGAAVARTTQLLQAVADGAPDAVFVKDQDGKYLLFNKSAARYAGKPVEDVLGKDDTVIFSAEDARKVMASDRLVMDTNQNQTIEELLVTAIGPRTFQTSKSPYRGSNGNVIGLIGISRDITEQKRTEEALRLRDRAIQAVSQGILITDPNQPDNPIIYAGAGFERMTGYRPEEVLGRNSRFLQGKDTDRRTVEELRSAIAERRNCSVEILNYRKDGTPFWNQLSIFLVPGVGGELTHFIGVQTDVTERRRFEEQLRQAQKMEAFGQLAGGVAHDFNNLLMVISGYSDMLLTMLSPQDPKREAIKAISEAGERAASLTRQMLAFSRQTVLAPRVLDINAAVRETESLLRRLIGEDVLLTTALDPNVGLIRVDPGQFGQVLMNLSVNARDAMSRGGKLTIATGKATLEVSHAKTQVESKPGEYVTLTVSDTGCGMSPEVKARIFEPFFTTKGVGKGTGLGLAVVHGIVKQSGGNIDVNTAPGAGTSFKLYFPAVKDAAPQPIDADPGKPSPGTETVLLAEDEESVRRLVMRALQLHGYTVLAAKSGEEALRLLEKHSTPLALLITDVVMPGMGGAELAEVLQARFPRMKVLFLSGYTDDAVMRHGIQRSQVPFLQKPFSPIALARKVREVLDRAKDDVSDHSRTD